MKDNDDFDGLMIVFEGADGVGTTTQSRMFEERYGGFWTREHCKDKMIGGKVDEMISEKGYSPQAISLGFAADRIVHLEEDVIPKLEKGELVIMDRYYHSSLVYQPVLGADYEWVNCINRNCPKPDLTIILDAEPETAMDRIEIREGETGSNIFENLDFQDRVIMEYRRLSEKLDEDIVFVDASGPKRKVFQRVVKAVEKKIPSLRRG